MNSRPQCPQMNATPQRLQINSRTSHTQIHPRWCHQPYLDLPMNIWPDSQYWGSLFFSRSFTTCSSIGTYWSFMAPLYAISHILWNIEFYSTMVVIIHISCSYNEFVLSCQVIDIYRSSAFNLKVKVGTRFNLGKSLVHQEVVHPIVPCQTRRYFAVTPHEAEHHPPFAFCTLCIETFSTRVTGSILCY